jgi:hypothetical protein
MGISRERLIKAAAAAFDFQRALVKYVLMIEKAAKEEPNNPELQDLLVFAVEKLKSNEENFKIVTDEIKNIRRSITNEKLREERRIANEERRKAKWLAKKNSRHPFSPLSAEEVIQVIWEGSHSSLVEKPNGEKQ